MDAFTKELPELRAQFAKHNKRIVRTRQTKNANKRFAYFKEAISTYNKFIELALELFDKLGYDAKLSVRDIFLEFKANILKYIGAYNLTNFPDPHDGYHIIEVDDDQLKALIETGLVQDNTPNSSDDETNRPIYSNQETQTIALTSNTQATQTSVLTHNTRIMADLTKLEFINACSRHVSSNYDGNFDTLRSFVNKIQFLKALATTTELQDILTTYILTKLDQKALSKIPENARTIDEILSALKGKIAHKASKVLEGQMIALTLDNKPLIDFQKQAEELAESYQLALVEEGIPLNIAEKLTIERTVDLCRKNTRSSEVKAILSASSHLNPAAVISKMVIGIDAVRHDKLLSDNKNKSDRGQAKHNRGRGRGRGRGHSQNGSPSSSSEHGNGNGHSPGRGNYRGRRGRGGNHGNRGGHHGQQGQHFYQPDSNVFQVQGNGQVPPNQGAQQNNNQQPNYQRTQ